MSQVQADPKAIASRRGNGINKRSKQEINLARRKQEQANQWRKEHGLK